MGFVDERLTQKGQRAETFADMMTLREIAKRFNTTPRTIRHYEFLELLKGYPHGRQRYYDRRAQARLKLVLRARRFGLRLEDIRQWLEVYDTQGPVPQLQRWLEISEGLEATLAQEIREKEAAREELRRVKRMVSTLLNSGSALEDTL